MLSFYVSPVIPRSGILRDRKFNMFYVYQLYSQKDKGFYIGYTMNIEERIRKHNNGEVISTKDRIPLLFIYCESYINEKDAKGREKFLKSGAGRRFLKKQLKNTYKDLGIDT